MTLLRIALLTLFTALLVRADWPGSINLSGSGSYHYGYDNTDHPFSGTATMTLAGDHYTVTGSAQMDGNAISWTWSAAERQVGSQAWGAAYNTTNVWVLYPSSGSEYLIQLLVNWGDGWVGVGDPYVLTGTAPDYVVSVDIPANTTDAPVQYTVTQGGVQIGSLTLQPGDPATRFNVHTASSGTTTVGQVVPAVHLDAEGFLVSGGSMTVNTLDVNPVPSGTTPSTVPVMPAPSVSEATARTGSTSTNGDGTRGVWRADSATSGLSDSVYKEGVDAQLSLLSVIAGASARSAASVDSLKASVDATRGAVNQVAVSVGQLNQSVTGDGLSVDAAPAVDVPAAVDLHSDTLASSLISKLPAAPQIQLPQPSATFSATLKLPTGQGAATSDYTVTVDPDAYPGVSIFRAICLAVLTLTFFFLVLRAVKEAFA